MFILLAKLLDKASNKSKYQIFANHFAVPQFNTTAPIEHRGLLLHTPGQDTGLRILISTTTSKEMLQIWVLWKIKK